MRLQNQVGLRLKALREQRGLSQEALAALCNLHRTYIGLIERGERSLSIPTIEAISSALGIQPAELFERTAVSGSGARPVNMGRSSGVGRLAAEMAAVKQVLFSAKIIDPERFEDLVEKATGKK